MEIANTILAQLGGNKFLAMTGAKNLFAIPGGIQMDLPRNASKFNKLRIVLTSADLYDVEFIKQAGAAKMFACVATHKFGGLYADMLVPTFEKITGMKTKI